MMNQVNNLRFDKDDMKPIDEAQLAYELANALVNIKILTEGNPGGIASFNEADNMKLNSIMGFMCGLLVGCGLASGLPEAYGIMLRDLILIFPPDAPQSADEWKARYAPYDPERKN